jgi:hypothetical protein
LAKPVKTKNLVQMYLYPPPPNLMEGRMVSPLKNLIPGV